MAPRALSMMSSASPSSQCGLRVQVAPPAGASAPTSPLERLARGQLLAPGADRDVGLLATDRDVRVGAGWGCAGAGRRASASISRELRVELGDPLAGRDRRGLAGRRPRGRPGSAPPLIASPIRFEAALRSALSASLSPSSRRRSASSSSARSTSAGSSPLSIAPWRMTSGSSRSRCRPTLMRAPPCRGAGRPRPQPLAADDTNAGSRLASSQPARGPLVRPRNAR